MFDRKSRYEKKLAPGDVLFTEGDQGDEMYLIRVGKVKLTKGQEEEERIISILKEGDFFGEMVVIDGSPRNSTCTALEDTSLIVIDRETFNSKVAENPLINYIIETLTKKYKASQEQIKFLMIRNDERRVISLLLSRVKETGVRRETGVELAENFSYEGFANVTGVDVTRVREYLQRLEAVGLVTIKNDRLSVRSVPELEEYIEYVALREKFER